MMKGGRDNEPVHATTFTNRRALLVGCNYVGSAHHDGRSLRNAEHDVEEIQAKLLELDWEVKALVGPRATGSAIRAGLNWLATDSTRDDQVLIYLAGHGELDEVNPGVGSYVPYDGGPSEGDDELRRSRWIPFSIVTKFLGAYGPTAPKHVFVLVDTCHSGAASATRGRPPRQDVAEVDLSHATREHVRRKAHVLLASTRAHEKADDGTSDHSPFAQGVIQALDRVLAGAVQTSAHVYTCVYDALDRAGAAQVPTPNRYTGEGVEFIFLPRQ